MTYRPSWTSPQVAKVTCGEPLPKTADDLIADMEREWAKVANSQQSGQLYFVTGPCEHLDWWESEKKA